jgi:hypothetical protein
LNDIPLVEADLELQAISSRASCHGALIRVVYCARQVLHAWGWHESVFWDFDKP